MKWRSKSKKKKYSLKRLFNSFGYAFNGILTVYKTEQNILFHTIIAIIVIGLGIYLKVSTVEFSILIILIGLVLGFEIINTSIKYTIDMLMPNVHPMAKMAKDASSGAVLVISLIALFVGIIILLPKVLLLI